MPIPIDVRKKPIDIKVRISTGEGVDVTWSDGHSSHYDFLYLRDNCPCALCRDERDKKANAPVKPSPIGGMGSPLPMFKPKPKAVEASAVGSYAIQIKYSDGHATGIYSYEYLRENCPCDACAREFRHASHAPQP
jgi:DUF971 family protein